MNVHPKIVIIHDKSCNCIHDKVAQTDPHVETFQLIKRTVVVVVIDENADCGFLSKIIFYAELLGLRHGGVKRS